MARSDSLRRLGVGVALIVASGAVVAGIALRFYVPSPLWLDEAQSVAIARLPLPQLFDALRADGAPPLYYLLLHAWIGVFGAGDVAVRSLSLVFGLAALPLLWEAGTRVAGGRAGGLVAVGVGATLPWMVRYASEARMYSLVVVLSLLAFLALHAVLRSASWRAVAALAVVTGALLLTHYWALFLYAVTGAGLLTALAVRRRRSLPVSESPLIRALVGFVLGAIAFLPWLPSFLSQVRRTGAPWAELPDLQRFAALPGMWAAGDRSTGQWLTLLLVCLLALGAVARPRVRRWRSRAGGAVDRHAGTGDAAGMRYGVGLGGILAAGTFATLLVGLVVARLTGSGIEPRYTAVVLPFVVLVATRGIVALPRGAAAAVFGLFLVLGAVTSWDLVSHPRTQAGQIAARLNAEARPGDVIVYCPDQLSPAVSRLLEPGVSSRAIQIPVPAGSRPERVDWLDYEERIDATSPSELAASALAAAGPHAVWVFSSPEYRTHTALCGGLAQELDRAGRTPRTAVGKDESAFERGTLTRWAVPT